MKDKDSSNAADTDVAAYWLLTVMEDRAETAGAPVRPVTDAEGEDRR